MKTDQIGLKEAVLWKPDEEKKVQCYLCNWMCNIKEGNKGYCSVRQNIEGKLYSLNYDKICALNSDPIEKKPLFHFQPGTSSMSVAAMGCNFRCEFCQNWQISQAAFDEGTIEGESVRPELIVDAAVRQKCKSIAYTYTEPTIFMELCDDCGRLAKEKELSNVFVSNGYMTIEAVDYVKEWLDAINIDLKSFNDVFYRKVCKARLQPVLDTIKYIARETGIWLELTTLIVPGQNDSEDELKALADFIANEAGPDVPWHISRYFPAYHFSEHATAVEELQMTKEIGEKAGINYIYLGNVPGSSGENTYCPDCGELLLERVGYRTHRKNLKDSRCGKCAAVIPGVGL